MADYVSIRELARLLSVSDQTVYQWSSKGMVPGKIKVGRSVRYNRAVVEEWLKNGGNSNDSQE